MFLLLSLFSFFSLIFLHLFSIKQTKGVNTYPFIGCLISFHNNRRRILEWYTNLLALSSSLTIVLKRVGARRNIVTANPENVEYILKTNFGNYPKGRPFTSVLGDFLGDGIFNVDDELWITQRKMAAHGFTARFLRTCVMETMEDEVNSRLLPLLQRAMEEHTVLDLQELLKKFTFDVVCRISLGVDNSTNSNSTILLLKAFDKACEVIALRGRALLPCIWKLKRAFGIGEEGELKNVVKYIHSYVYNIIEMKKIELEHNLPGNDMLSKLLLTCQDDGLIRDMVISFIMAGKDTTSAAMTWFFWQLSRDRITESSILDELNTVSNKTKLGYESLKKMSFTKASLMESMRLFPPVPWDSKHAISGDVLPDGTAVHGGDRVTYFPYGMGRTAAIWGRDCMEYRPGRWLEEDGRSMKKVNEYKYPVFQGGPRVCLGKEMAFLQMIYVVGCVVGRYRVVPVASEDPVYVPLLTAHMNGGFKVLIQGRRR